MDTKLPRIRGIGGIFKKMFIIKAVLPQMDPNAELPYQT
jgi:hypothetical protein